MRLLSRVLVASAACAALSACAHDGPANDPAPAGVTVVDMTSGLKYVPATITIKAGQSVEWRNKAFMTHTVTDDPAKVKDAAHVALPAGAAAFDSGEPSWNTPPSMQRPKCSMKLPYSLRSMAPRVFALFTRMRARRSSAARTLRRISGEVKAAAMAARRVSFMRFPLYGFSGARRRDDSLLTEHGKTVIRRLAVSLPRVESRARKRRVIR